MDPPQPEPPAGALLWVAPSIFIAVALELAFSSSALEGKEIEAEAEVPHFVVGGILGRE